MFWKKIKRSIRQFWQWLRKRLRHLFGRWRCFTPMEVSDSGNNCQPTIFAQDTLQEPSPQIQQNIQGDRNQTIGQISGKTAIGNVEKNVFVGGTQMQISGGNITNLTGCGDIHYQEASHPIRQSIDRSDEEREPSDNPE